jgi:hypothetical protein
MHGETVKIILSHSQNTAFEYHPVSITCRPIHCTLHQSKNRFVVTVCSCRTTKLASGPRLLAFNSPCTPHFSSISSFLIYFSWGYQTKRKFSQPKKAESVSGRSVGVLEERVLLMCEERMGMGEMSVLLVFENGCECIWEWVDQNVCNGMARVFQKRLSGVLDSAVLMVFRMRCWTGLRTGAESV